MYDIIKLINIFEDYLNYNQVTNNLDDSSKEIPMGYSLPDLDTINTVHEFYWGFYSQKLSLRPLLCIK